MKRHFMRQRGLACILLCGVTPWGLAAPDRSLADVLAHMDEASSHFKALSANVDWVQHMEAIHEDDAQSGTIQVKRPRPKDLHVRIAFEKPEPKIALIDGSKVEVYTPRTGEVQRYELGHRRSLVDMILALGFGGSSRELLSAYGVRMGGAETISGESAMRLELTPKSSEMLAEWKRIDLWISDKTGYTLQQKFFDHGGKDYTLITYTKVQLNPELPDSVFKLDLPKGVKRETVNKK